MTSTMLCSLVLFSFVQSEVQRAAWMAALEGRDAEARWVALRAPLAEDEARAELLDWLAAEGDEELLEWVALTGREGARQALALLVERDSPRWPRLAAWQAESADSHAREAALRTLRGRPGDAAAWLAAWTPPAGSSLARLAAELPRGAEPTRPAAERAPPVDLGALFAPLSAPVGVARLGERANAEPGVLYLHQLERALDALAATRRRPPAVLADVFALARHPDPELARAALLAATRFAPEELPVDELRTLVDDPSLPGGVREAALLALSYGPDVEAYPRLTWVAASPEHPAWRAALARLGDIGDAFTLEWLPRRLGEAGLDEERRPILARELARVLARLAENPERALLELLRHAAWIDVLCDPLEIEMPSFAVRTAREAARASRAEPGAARLLERLASGEAEIEGAALERAVRHRFEERVRDYARRALAEAGRGR